MRWQEEVLYNMKKVIFENSRPNVYQRGFEKKVQVLFNEVVTEVEREIIHHEGEESGDNKSEIVKITQYVYNYLEFNEKPSKSEFITSYIRDKYSESDEIALLRQKDDKPEEYQAWYDYAEQAKQVANGLGLV